MGSGPRPPLPGGVLLGIGELVVPNQQEGDMSRLAPFPNPAYRRRLEAERETLEREATQRNQAAERGVVPPSYRLRAAGRSAD